MAAESGKGTGMASLKQMPAFMYGCAWKKDRTKVLVKLAVGKGFRGVDTACQPKHYYEPGVGEALQELIAEGVVTREDIFLQTKFTSLQGQDPNNIPYDKQAPLQDCVRRSFEVSLQNLQTEYLDSLLMHSPMQRFSDTLAVWRVFEELHASGRVRQLGMSNTYDLQTLKQLYAEAVVKPSVLQNRFYADSGYDVEIRNFCSEHSIRYQSFWTLTANPHVIKTPEVGRLAAKYGTTPAGVFFMYVRALGITPLTGTCSAEHMQQDLSSLERQLEPADFAIVDALL